MAQKKTNSPRVPRTASRALKSKATSKATKKLAGGTLSQGPGKHRKGKDVAQPKRASQIRREVGVTARDRSVARKAARR